MKAPPIKRIETCKYCTDYKGRPKLILPEELWGAKKMPDGSYKCLTCQAEEIQDKIIKVTPNSDRAKEILVERAAKQKKEMDFRRREAEIRKMRGQRLKI